MPHFTDQTGRTVHVPIHPQRIVSLVPSQTELMFYLELGAAVAGITKFCVHPKEWHRSKTRIGGTKDIDIPLIRSLQPQLIIAGKEENVLEQVAQLWDAFPTWVSDVHDLPSALQMIQAVGVITGMGDQANNLAHEVQNAFKCMPPKNSSIKAAYLIWRKPYMTVGCDTFIHHMMREAGFDNVFKDAVRYPVVTVDDIRTKGCSVVLLSSEPYPYKETHAAELAAAVPGVTTVLVDGEMFSWYGSRLLKSPAYFSSLYHTVAKALAAAKLHRL